MSAAWPLLNPPEWRARNKTRGLLGPVLIGPRTPPSPQPAGRQLMEAGGALPSDARYAFVVRDAWTHFPSLFLPPPYWTSPPRKRRRRRSTPSRPGPSTERCQGARRHLLLHRVNGAAPPRLGTLPTCAAPCPRGSCHSGDNRALAPDLCDTDTSRNIHVRSVSASAGG